MVVARHAAKAILEEAETPANSFIALSSHVRGGLKRPLLGSVADKVLPGAGVPVLICRPSGPFA